VKWGLNPLFTDHREKDTHDWPLSDFPVNSENLGYLFSSPTFSQPPRLFHMCYGQVTWNGIYKPQMDPNGRDDYALCCENKPANLTMTLNFKGSYTNHSNSPVKFWVTPFCETFLNPNHHSLGWIWGKIYIKWWLLPNKYEAFLSTCCLHPSSSNSHHSNISYHIISYYIISYPWRIFIHITFRNTQFPRVTLAVPQKCLVEWLLKVSESQSPCSRQSRAWFFGGFYDQYPNVVNSV